MHSRISLLLLMFAFNVGLINCGGQSLVSPQSNCRIRCENGGMCVFDLDRPDFHSCICLLGVYTGGRCQIKVATTDDVETTTMDSAGVETAHPKNIQQPQQSEVDREDARRRDEERKREYERQVAERTRKEKEDRDKAADEERRRQQHEQYWREETARREQQRAEAERRIQDQRVRDDERRRQHESERAQLEERRREEETRRLAAQKEAEEARARDEERRRQESEKESQKEMNDKRTQSMNEQFEYEGDEDYPQVAEKEDEYDEGYETEKTEDVMVTSTTKTSKQMKPMIEEEKEIRVGAGGDDGSDMEMEKDEMENEQTEDDDEPLKKEDEQLIDSIKHVFNKAVDETVKEHPIDSDDYWDDNSKKSDEDRWSESETTMKTEEADEYGMEEGTEGWMMVKKENENSSAAISVPIILFFSLIVYFF